MNFTFANYGNQRALDCTPEEQEMFDFLAESFPDDGLTFVRVSDDYVTVKRGEWDIVRMKFTDRAKWLMFPTAENGRQKHKVESTEQIKDFFDQVRESIETAKKYED